MFRRAIWHAGMEPASRTSVSHLLLKQVGLVGMFAAGLNIGCTGARVSTIWSRPTFAVAKSADADRQTHLHSARSQSTAQGPERDPWRSLVVTSVEEDSPVIQPTAAQRDVLPPIDGHAGDIAELPTGGLTLPDLEALAMQNNPTLSQAQAAVSAEQGIYRQSGLYPNPQVGYLNGTASNPSVKNSNGMFLSQEFVTAHKLDLAQKSALVEIQRYQWDIESQRFRILNDLKIRYYEVLGAQEAMAVSAKLVKLAEHGVKMAEQNVLARQSSRSDLLQAQVQLETVQLSREEAEHRHAAAWEQLATIAGLSPLTPVKLAGDLSADIPHLDLESSWEHLLSNSPQLRSTECDLGHAWATYREARAQAIPNVTVQAVGEFDRATNATTVSTLVALPFPVFNRNQGNIDKSSADIVAAQAEIGRVQLVLRDQMADSFRRYKTSLRQVERLRKVIELTEENLALTEKVFEAREAPLMTVLQAQQAASHNQLAYVEALTELHKVATEIQGMQLTGGLNPAAIGSAIQNQPGGGAQRQRALLNEVQDRASKQLLPAASISQ